MRSFLLFLIPIGVAFLAIRGLRRAVYGLVAAAALTAVLVRAQGGEVEGLGEVLVRIFDYGVLKLALMVGGMTMIAVGPARYFARDLILRVPGSGFRQIVGIVLAGASGFGNSLSAVDLLASVFPPSPRRTAAELAPLAAACTLGPLLVPFSPWWIFFQATVRHPIQAYREVWVGPVAFALAIFVGLGLGRAREERERRTKEPYELLRPRRAPLRIVEAAPWLLFMGPLVALPLLAPREGDGVSHALVFGILAGTAASLGFCLLLDLGGERQVLWSGAHGVTPQGAVALAELRSEWPATHARDERGGLLGRDASDAEAPSAIVLLLPRRRRQREGLALARLRASVQIHLGAWQDGLKSGAMTGAIVLAVGLFRAYNEANVAVSGFRLRPEWFGSTAVLALVAFTVVVATALGIGWVLGTAFGTFALTFVLVAPLLSALPPPMAATLLGLLVALSAAVNSSSNQADNVAAVAHATRASDAEVSQAAKPVVLAAAVAASVACLAVVVAEVAFGR